MNASDVDQVFAACEAGLDRPGRLDLSGLGFWRAVAAVKREPTWIERFAERAGAIDRRAFLARVPIAIPIAAGVALLTFGAAVGIAFLVAAFLIDSEVIAGVAVLLGTGALIGTTHDLAHVVSGAAVGIRFTHLYSDLPKRPQPGVKLDYASYLSATPRGRAWMHASGAIVTKLLPFVMVPVAIAAGTPWWTSVALVAIGAVQLITDALFSVRAGDWKKFQREMRFARR